MTDTGLTFLEKELFDRMNVIKTYQITPKYLPKRVEPGLAVDLTMESKWSKYIGETLFINQKILSDQLLSDSIFWREAFLLFVDKEFREIWWIKILADIFPYSIKLTNEHNGKWSELLEKTSDSRIENLDFYKGVAVSIGTKGLIEVLRICIDNVTKGIKNNEIINLSSQEFRIILDNVSTKFIDIPESAIDILKIALIKQTNRPIDIVNFTDKSCSTISKLIKKLQDGRILFYCKNVSNQSLGLIKYHVLMNFTRERSKDIEKMFLKSPFVITEQINCINSCIAIIIIFGPDDPKFLSYLNKYCKNLLDNIIINEYFIFKVEDILTNYNFKYLNLKTKKQEFNLSNIIIDYDLMKDNIMQDFESLRYDLDNILLKANNYSSKLGKLDQVDMEIIEQIYQGVLTRRGIQKNIRKDMNETVRRLQKLEELNVVNDFVLINIPDNNGRLAIYIQDYSSKLKTTSLKDRLEHLCYHLPYVNFSKISGTFNGFLLNTKLPYENVLELIDNLNKFFVDCPNMQIVMGSPTYFRINPHFPSARLIDNKWVFLEEDFSS
ncbi:MAG: hypothetical protein ACFFDW_04225 [Candidatus Thorarchaeota archaeon]